MIVSQDMGSICVGDRYLIYNKNLIEVQPLLSVGALDINDKRHMALPRAWLQNVEMGSLPASWHYDTCIRCPNPQCRSYNLKGATMCWSCLAHWLRIDAPSELS